MSKYLFKYNFRIEEDTIFNMKLLPSIFCIVLASLVQTAPKHGNDYSSMYFSQFSEDSEKFLTEMPEPHSEIKLNPSDIKIFFYSRTTDGKQVNITKAEEVKETDYSPSKDTFFIIHGWINDHQAPMCQSVKNAYLAAGDVNVFVVDWSRLSMGEYVMARNQVVQIGKIIADFISSLVTNKLLSYEKITVVGHSLGAHIAGTTGKALNGSLDTIIGLDPAGPLFFIQVERDRLDKKDAKFVQVIHTCAGRLGFGVALGHTDYWPNGGNIQPACPNNIDVIGVCSHGLSYEYFAESVRTGNFKAWKCSTYQEFEKNLCKSNSMSYFGQLQLDKTATGNFYLETNSKSPYAKGDKQEETEKK